MKNLGYSNASDEEIIIDLKNNLIAITNSAFVENIGEVYTTVLVKKNKEFVVSIGLNEIKTKRYFDDHILSMIKDLHFKSGFTVSQTFTLSSNKLELEIRVATQRISDITGHLNLSLIFPRISSPFLTPTPR